MLPNEDIVIVLTTVSSEADAQSLATLLIEASLAACVQIDSPIESHYIWQGQKQVDREYRLVIKTTLAATDKLIETLGAHHPYDQPQLLVVPVIAAAPGYARWVTAQVAIGGTSVEDSLDPPRKN